MSYATETTESPDDVYDIPNLYNDSALQTSSKLILCVEEINDRGLIDNRLFIGWSREDNDYFIRGKRQDSFVSNYVPYAFQCETTDALYDFIKFVVGTRNTSSVILYNYNNIYPLSPNKELTYEFFEENIDKNYEIAGYDGIKLKRKYIKNILRIMKNMYNMYNVD